MFCFVLLVTKLADVLFNNVSITQFRRDVLFQKVFEFEENFELWCFGFRNLGTSLNIRSDPPLMSVPCRSWQHKICTDL